VQEPSLVAGHPEIQPLLTERAQRAKLLEAMVQAVAEKGYAAATVADAVRLARVSRGTFYALFASKEACFAEAYALGADVLETRVAAAVRAASDWREELRLGLRAYLQTLHEEPRFARAYLLESHHVPAARDAIVARFAARYGRSFLRSGLPVPPPEALFVLAAGVDQLACARVRAGDDVLTLEDTLVGCAVRLVATEEDHAWT
jgi:AcrR family transcriptional regulator